MLIRPATIEDIPAIARVNVDSWRSSYRGIVPNAFLEELSYAKQEERNRRYLAEQVICLVAESPDAGVIGYIRGGPERSKDPGFQAEIYAIYLLQQYQGQGIGRSLLRRWSTAQRQLGFNSALVWVLEQNKPAVGFYQRMGGRFVRTQKWDAKMAKMGTLLRISRGITRFFSIFRSRVMCSVPIFCAHCHFLDSRPLLTMVDAANFNPSPPRYAASFAARGFAEQAAWK